MNNNRSIYLDYAATTPTDSQVIEAMSETYRLLYGNPSSLHFAGQQTRQAVEQAREIIADGLGADPDEIIFTGSGSEADNLALRGIAEVDLQRRHIITSAIEHHAILETCEYLEKNGYTITCLPVDSDGIVQPDILSAALRPDTRLVSIMHANNEIGTIQPIAKLAEVSHARGALFHTDAVQTVGQVSTRVDELGVDLLTLSAHKFYGPKGVGILYVRRDVELVPLIHGGAQEHHRRAGTENVPGIVGSGLAFQLAQDRLSEESARLSTLRDDLWQRLQTGLPQVRLNGHPTQRLPNNLNISFKNVESEGLLLRLSRAGIAASMGSACNSESIEPSHVIQALGVPEEWARGALRLTIGSATSSEDITRVADTIINIVMEMQADYI